jgi:hypothetical protein
VRGELVLTLGVLFSTTLATSAHRQVTLKEPGAITRPTAEWTVLPNNEMPNVVEDGPALHLKAGAERTLVRAGWTVAGTFAVSAVFQPTASSQSGTAYGFVLGCGGRPACAMAVLLRADGAISVRRPSDTGADWLPAPAGRSAANGDVLLVHVEGTNATVTVNGQARTTVRLTAKELDGPLGLHVGTGGDVVVNAFSTESAPTSEVVK